jgi:hypothetical protein
VRPAFRLCPTPLPSILTTGQLPPVPVVVPITPGRPLSSRVVGGSVQDLSDGAFGGNLPTTTCSQYGQRRRVSRPSRGDRKFNKPSQSRSICAAPVRARFHPCGGIMSLLAERNHSDRPPAKLELHVESSLPACQAAGRSAGSGYLCGPNRIRAAIRRRAVARTATRSLVLKSDPTRRRSK